MPPNIRLKAPANANKAKHLHIGFNPDARSEYLRGFSKRKVERRRYGLAMGELKRKKAVLEERKERRELEKLEKEAFCEGHVELVRGGGGGAGAEQRREPGRMTRVCQRAGTQMLATWMVSTHGISVVTVCLHGRSLRACRTRAPPPSRAPRRLCSSTTR